MSSTGALQSAAAAIYNNNNKTSHAFVSACALSAEVLYKNDPASVTAGLTQGYQKVYYMPNVYSDLSLVEAKRAGLDKSLVFDKVGVLNIATFNKSFVELPKFAVSPRLPFRSAFAALCKFTTRSKPLSTPLPVGHRVGHGRLSPSYSAPPQLEETGSAPRLHREPYTFLFQHLQPQHYDP